MKNIIQRSIALIFIIYTHHAVLAADVRLLPGIQQNENIILIDGVIENSDDYKFYQIALETQNATVILNSPGGSVDAGISIGAEISIRGYSTFVPKESECYSICAIIWVSGSQRFMSAFARIGVHAAYSEFDFEDGNKLKLESGVANAQIGAFLNQLGLSMQAVRYFTSADPDNLLPLTPQIVQKLDIDVFVKDGPNLTPPENRITPRRIARQASEFIGIAAYCLDLFEVNSNYLVNSAEKALRSGHELFGADIFIDLVSEYTAFQKGRISKEGVAYWCIRSEKNLREDGLITGIRGPSYNCAQASNEVDRTICFSKDLWAWDQVMASIYVFLRKVSDDKLSAEILKSQRVWLKRRNLCLSNETCLIERYSSRLFDFEQLIKD